MSSVFPRPYVLRWPRLLAVVALLLVGLTLRSVEVGTAPLQGDEAWLTYLAYNFGHNGQRAELGVTSSAGINQPPFFHDVFALPFAFDPDPRIARLFMAILQLLGMALFFLLIRRYWRYETALAALAIFAVLPRAVVAGRFLWNPYLAIPFLIAFLLTSLLASEGKRWGRWLCLPMLACAIGAHPILAVTGLLWLICALRDWLTSQRRRIWARDYLISIALAGLVLLPWGLGVLHQRMAAPSQGVFVPQARSPLTLIGQFTVQAATTLDFGAFAVPTADTIPTPVSLVTLTDLLGWLTFLGSVFLIGRSVARWRAHQPATIWFPDLAMALFFLIPPGVMLLSPTRTFDQYFIALVPASAAIQAFMLFGGRSHRVTAKQTTANSSRRLRYVLAAAICAVYAAYIGSALIGMQNLTHFTRDSMPSLDAMIDLRNAAVRPGIETIYLVDSGSPRAFEQDLAWLTLASRGPSRVIWGNNFALPVPQNGATYVGYADSTLIPELYSDPAPRIVADNLYRVVDLPPNRDLPAACTPTGVTRLANGVTILGYRSFTPANTLPQPNQPWTIELLWTAGVSQSHTSYQVFNHLVDADGTKYAQSDLPTLPTDLWRDGDLYVSKVTLTPGAALPANRPLYLRVGMYTLPTATQPQLGGVNAIDAQGNPAGGWVTIPICMPTHA